MAASTSSVTSCQPERVIASVHQSPQRLECTLAATASEGKRASLAARSHHLSRHTVACPPSTPAAHAPFALTDRARPYELPAADKSTMPYARSQANACVDPLALSLKPDRKSTRLNSSHLGISYAVFCLKKKNKT